MRWFSYIYQMVNTVVYECRDRLFVRLNSYRKLVHVKSLSFVFVDRVFYNLVPISVEEISHPSANSLKSVRILC